MWRRLDSVPAVSFLQMTAAVHGRVLDPEAATRATILTTVRDSRVPEVMLGPALRRALRPRGALARRATAAGRPVSRADLLTKVNEGTLPVVSPVPQPRGMVTVDQAAALLPAILRPPKLCTLTSDWAHRTRRAGMGLGPDARRRDAAPEERSVM